MATLVRLLSHCLAEMASQTTAAFEVQAADYCARALKRALASAWHDLMSNYVVTVALKGRFKGRVPPRDLSVAGQLPTTVVVKLEEQLPAFEDDDSPEEEEECNSPRTDPIDLEECCICMEAISGRCAILEQCYHVYCEPCLLRWMAENVDQPVSCPICRATSSKVALVNEPPVHFATKRTLFDSVICCLHQRPPVLELAQPGVLPHYLEPTMREGSFSDRIQHLASPPSYSLPTVYYGRSQVFASPFQQ